MNRSDYEKALVQRGSITFCLSDDFEKNWRYIGEKHVAVRMKIDLPVPDHSTLSKQ